MLKILHLAPQNYAGVPYSFYKMHLHCGDKSRLITFHKNSLDFPEDVCLNLPLPNFSLAKKWRKHTVNIREKELTPEEPQSIITTPDLAPVFAPKNIFEHYYFSLNDLLKKNKIESIIKEYDLDSYDIIHYDAGLDFFRNASQAIKWKKQGKKIVCCYFGSDLRIRGIIKPLDNISDLNITSEYDHLKLKQDLHYLFYPFDPSELPPKNNLNNETLTIVHSPTNRKYKGTDLIISVIDRIKKEKNINFLLLENIPRPELIKIKAKADISIDQVGGTMGGTGYGKAGLETLAIGIPTITNMTPDYASWLPENPFTVANNQNELYSKLNFLIDNPSQRIESGNNGISWVKKYHGFEQVNKKLFELYKLKGIV
jgi:glycosyltransferase involved in cell wall biosynthesis